MKTVVTVLAIAALCICAWAADNAVVGARPTANHQPSIAGRQSLDALTIPAMLSYQGKLTDTSGAPVPNADYTVAFKLYTVPSGGSAFWNEMQTVTTKSGLFSILLGSVAQIETVPSSGNLYLGMAVAGGAELSPRLRLVGSAYSYLAGKSANSDQLEGKDTTALDTRYVNEGQASSVTSNMIVNGTIAAADLGQMGASSGQVMKWTGSAWAPAADNAGGPPSGPAGGDLTGTYPNPTIHLPYSGSVASGSDVFTVTNTQTQQDVVAISGYDRATDYCGTGVVGWGGYKGMEGICEPTDDWTYYGVYGTCDGGSGTNYGVEGYAGGSGAKRGVYGYAYGAGTNYGVYGLAGGSGTNYAGYFSGNVMVTGNLSKGGGSFQIDHPLDPLDKYLFHSFVESPDMMNIYNGNIVSDARGYATVSLPDWFQALNRDFRYQLTVIDERDTDGFAQAKVVRGVKDNSFVIRTSAPFTTVSWQVTGIRQDPYANANRIQVEVDKPAGERGKYIHPEAYGLPKEVGIGYPSQDNDKKAKAVRHDR